MVPTPYWFNWKQHRDRFMQNKFEDLQEKIIDWADDKGIFEKATPLTQLSKTMEEVQELHDAIVDNNRDEIVDAIGDIIVTLIIQAEMNNLDPVECLESAYNVIAKRTGKMVDGVFVKDEA